MSAMIGIDFMNELADVLNLPLDTYEVHIHAKLDEAVDLVVMRRFEQGGELKRVLERYEMVKKEVPTSNG